MTSSTEHDDLTGEWRDEDGRARTVSWSARYHPDGWHVTYPDGVTLDGMLGSYIRSNWSRVPDAEPADTEQVRCGDGCDLAHGRLALCDLPRGHEGDHSELRKGDPYKQTWPQHESSVPVPVLLSDEGYAIPPIPDGWEIAAVGPFGVTLRRKPAPSPPPAWDTDNAAPYWHHAGHSGNIWTLSQVRSEGPMIDPSEWVGVHLIPADLIEKLRGADVDEQGDLWRTAASILDAADGA